MGDANKQLTGTIVVDTSGLKREAELAVKQFDKIRASIDAIPMSMGKMDASFAKLDGLKKDIGKSFSIDPKKLKGIQEYWAANAEGVAKFKDALKGGSVKPFANALEKADTSARRLSLALTPLIQKTLIYQQAVAPEKFKRFDKVLKLIERDLQANAEKTKKLATAQEITKVKTEKLTEKFEKQDKALKNSGKSLETYRRQMRDFGNANIMMGRTINRFFTAPILAGATVAVKGAIDVEAGIKKLNVVFGNFAKKAERQAQSFGKAFGLAPQTMRESMGMMGDMLVGFGLDQETAFEQVKKLSQKAADLGAFQPQFDFKEIARRFATATTGETESLKPVGIAVLQNNKEFQDAVKGYMELNGSSQMLARSMVIIDEIMKQTYQSVDFLKNNWETLPIVVGRIIEKVKELKNAVGEKLLNESGLGESLKKIPDYIDDIIKKVKDLKKEDIAGYIKKFKVVAGTGIVLMGTGQSAKFLANLTIAAAGATALTGKFVTLGVKIAALKALFATAGVGATLATATVSLGVVSTLVLAIGAALTGWKIGNELADFFDRVEENRERKTGIFDADKESAARAGEEARKLIALRGTIFEDLDEAGVNDIASKVADINPYRMFGGAREEAIRQLKDYSDKIEKLRGKLTKQKYQEEIWATNEAIDEKRKIRDAEKLAVLAIAQGYQYKNLFSNEEKYQTLLAERERLQRDYNKSLIGGANGEGLLVLDKIIENNEKLQALKEGIVNDSKIQDAKIVTNSNVAHSSEVGTSKALEDMYRTTQYEPAKIDQKIADNTSDMKKGIGVLNENFGKWITELIAGGSSYGFRPADFDIINMAYPQ